MLQHRSLAVAGDRAGCAPGWGSHQGGGCTRAGGAPGQPGRGVHVCACFSCCCMWLYLSPGDDGCGGRGCSCGPQKAVAEAVAVAVAPRRLYNYGTQGGSEWLNDGCGSEWLDDGCGSEWLGDGCGSEWLGDGCGSEWLGLYNYGTQGSIYGTQTKLTCSGRGLGMCCRTCA